MTALLNRLVARAAGRERSGLRVRLPARFEAPNRIRDVDTVGSEDTGPPSVAKSDDAPSEARAPPSARPPPAANTPAQAPPPRPAPARALTPPPAREAQATPAAAAEEIAEPRSSRAVEPGAPTLRAASREPGPAPARPAALANVATPLPPAGAAGEPKQGRLAPAPLLDVERTAPSVLADAASITTAARAAREPFERRSAEASEQAPEIAIHIDRIELRTEPEKPQARRRAARAGPRVPSLSDYLRGRGR